MPGSKRLLTVTATAAGLCTGAVATPADGTTIAYTSQGATSSHVWVMRGDGTQKDRLTSGSVDDVSPSLAPGGGRLVFVRRLAGRRDDLYRVGADGTGLTRLTRTAVAEANPAWAPRGGRLAFEAGSALGSSEIVVVRSDGGGRRALTSNSVDDANPAWAPGGRRLAFVRYVRGRNAAGATFDAFGTA